MRKMYVFRIRKKFRPVALFLSVLLICICCLRPASVHAATSEVPERATHITAMSVVLFYAGVIGALIGAATGWVNAWFMRPEPGKKPLKKEINE